MNAFKKSMMWSGMASVFLACVALDVRPMAISELASYAQMVVRGKVLSKEVGKTAEGRIFTKVQVQVRERWKGGSSESVVTVVHGGGTIGNRISLVPGQVEYSVGEEIVLFAVVNERGQAVTAGLMQGKFHVEKDPVSGVELASSPFHGQPDGNNSATSKAAVETMAVSGKGSLTVEQLKQQVMGVGK